MSKRPPVEQWLFKRQDACTYLGISPAKYDDLVRNGHLEPWLPVGFKRGSYLTRQQLDDFIELSRNPPIEEPPMWTPDVIVPLRPTA